jgi:hypothetical protein
MREIEQSRIKEVSGGISFTNLVATMVTGAVAGALRGIPGGPVAMIGSAIFGAGMAAAGTAIVDASTIHDVNH